MASVVKKRTITRARETLTCNPCRSRKLKCDKDIPCSSCTKRGEAEACSYAKRPVRKEHADQSKTARAEERLQHLGDLLEIYASSGAVNNVTSHTEEDESSTCTNGSATYIGATHFSAMLDDIEWLRQYLRHRVRESSIRLTFLFGGTPRLPLQVVLANHLPPKIEVDRRLAAYFRAEAIAAPCIHTPHFKRHLFSILDLFRGVGRARLYDESPDEGHKHNFSLAATHCLAIGRYSRPQPLAVEALAVYIQAKVIVTLDPLHMPWAITVGYYREPDNFKLLTAFEGEMRRKTWSFAMQLDLLISFQLGLPNNVQFGSWDTRPPSNLKDEDFDEDSAVLPPPRPAHEPTKTTFYTAKHMLMTVFDKILKYALAAGSIRSEEELIALDAEGFQARYETLPAVLHYRSISTSLTDPAYIKCRCVLHRKHVTTGRLESIRVRFEAASQIVGAFFWEMYPELKPGGQFYDDRWLLGSITGNDYLLAVMVLCLLMCQSRRAAVPGLTQEELQSKADVSIAARRTRRIFEAMLSPCQGATANGTGTMQSDIDFTQSWNDPWSNMFDTHEWAFLEESLNSNFETQ
ncbi:Fusarisetin A cluster transcription factor fsa6 [Fulvia fulva]|uniref:Fusarisetin A cluster transcription factor fsa6 n=1 Tax=Passalora fulva TaxID=5499 RepID=A0A9Q8P2H2_PASFU|nr:Fusarisetin A cluster transcription factor fsa6 [Fulvia fulva]KAK4635947.1 Fusarisetin A cluster transcription factor fsa6 [Fulvia fulva]KAK4638006.1 Fusarisetin A cluster transcription factor fsa6 [Fulvia fulva]UJO10769.1 Fusarisetin A cluster transcription factor fsa6 [Fulvia fulva]WPV10083.1 Fusarisetin A cluster transcription factor fsa6 [Fulvia fulva]WPV24546.1 Fusarisetin A cluster transcription factor fsa6 [Fulvia fulva]